VDDAIHNLYGLALANRLTILTLAEVVRIWPDKMTYNVAYRSTDGKRHEKYESHNNFILHISVLLIVFTDNLMTLVDDDGTKANGTERNSQPQPVPEVAEKKLTQILCYFHILIVFLRFNCPV
jgi:hypothetical protein